MPETLLYFLILLFISCSSLSLMSAIVYIVIHLDELLFSGCTLIINFLLFPTTCVDNSFKVTIFLVFLSNIISTFSKDSYLPLSSK